MESVRKDISGYSSGTIGNAGQLESFHVDHDKGEVISVREKEKDFEGDLPEALGSMSLKEAPSEEELSEYGISKDRKIGWGFLGKGELPKYVRHSDGDNLKTMPDRKPQRANRGLIKKFLDSFSRN